MKYLITVLLLFIVHLLSAQESEMGYANGVFQFEENKVQKIFTDRTKVRQQPDVKARVLDSLSANQKILILQQDPAILKLGERHSHWYKISYRKGDENFGGYVWGGNLCVGYRNKNGYDFLFGLSKTEKRTHKQTGESLNQNIAGIKVLQGNHLIDETFFDTGSGEEISYGTFTIENSQLKNVTLTLKAMVSGEACGIASYDQYILFKDKKLIKLPQLMNVGDADVYYHSESFIFPNDKGGSSDTIIFKMQEMQKDDNDKEQKKYSSKTYLWDGNSYRLK